MLVKFEDLKKIYDKIKKRSGVNENKLVIFVANDCDALSALKILIYILQRDNMQYSLYPVFSYLDLEQKLTGLEETKQIIMINCGGITELTNMISAETWVYVFDNHRPI
jgi:single-stranded DNA-specific DHH superfamily exonuclease